MNLNMNQLATTQNSYQGDALKVLTVCSAGLLRSPSAAVILAGDPWNFNTRACGSTQEYALIPLSPALIYWADEIVCMSEEQSSAVKNMMFDMVNTGSFTKEQFAETPIHILHVPDRFTYMHEELVEILKEKFSEIY